MFSLNTFNHVKEATVEFLGEAIELATPHHKTQSQDSFHIYIS